MVAKLSARYSLMDEGEEMIWLLEVRKGIEKLDLFPVRFTFEIQNKLNTLSTEKKHTETITTSNCNVHFYGPVHIRENR